MVLASRLSSALKFEGIIIIICVLYDDSMKTWPWYKFVNITSLPQLQCCAVLCSAECSAVLPHMVEYAYTVVPPHPRHVALYS